MKRENVFSKKYYDVYTDSNETKYKQRQIMYLQELDRLKKFLPEGGKLLDFGCGVGDFTTLFGEGWDKYGVEISDFAKNMAQKKGIKFEISEMDFGTFDLVIFRGSIHYIKDKKNVLSYAKNLLKDNGVIVLLATPNPKSYYYKRYRNMPMLEKDKVHYLYSIEEIIEYATSLNMKVIFKYKPYWGTPYAKPLNDLARIIMGALLDKEPRCAFWGNMYEMVIRKEI